MGESACLVHSFSYSASISHESHEALDFPGKQTENSQGLSERESRLDAGNSAEMMDNPLHALSQSISFGRFMTESLEWGKWSSFSHKKYVEEAEKYSRPGSVAQKKAFFEAHYKRIAEAKKAAAAAANESPEEQAAEAVNLPNASESSPAQKQEIKEYANEIGSVTSTDGSGLNVENNEPGKKSFQMDAAKSEEDHDVDNNLFPKPVVADDDIMVPVVDNMRKKKSSVGNEDEVEELSKKDGSVGNKVEGRRSLSKNSPGWRVSVEISIPPRTSDAAKRNSFSENQSERMADHNSVKNDEVAVRRRFGFLNCLMAKSKTRDQNARTKKSKKQSLCLCFKPQTLGESESPRNDTEKMKGKSQL